MSDDSMTDEERLRAARARMIRAVSLAIITMIDRKYPDTHPEIIASALVETTATMIVMFANTEASAKEGADRGAETLRRAVAALYERRRRIPSDPTIH